MNRTNLLIAGLILLLILLGVAIYMQQETPSEVVIQTPPEVNVETEPAKVPIVHYPITEPTVPAETAPEKTQEPDKQPTTLQLPETLPAVEQSDDSLQKVLLKLRPEGLFMHLLVMDHFIPRLVVTIDNLPMRKLPQAHLPLKPPKGRFLVSGATGAPETSSKNYQRYEPYVRLLETFEPEFVIAIYKHYYPLFQTAYKQLGYRNAYFNDRLIQVLTHLLETPNPSEPQRLNQPSVLFTFADPSLEKLSSGQKILLRIGQENRRRVKKVLADYRQRLINQ